MFIGQNRLNSRKGEDIVYLQARELDIGISKKYRIVCDGTTAVVIDDDRTALVLLSLIENGNIRIERTYYAML